MADKIKKERRKLLRKAAATLLVVELCEEEKERWWKRGKTRSWIKRRDQLGYFATIVQELRIEDCAGYKEMLRMDHEQVVEICSLIDKEITPLETLFGHKAISSMARLTLTLRFLATGETYRSLSYQFRISRSAISYIVKQVCSAINKCMAPLYLKTPQNASEWKIVANTFEEKWQFPHCIGAIDGKHLVMQPPPGAGSKYYNYKHTHSIVLLAVAGPNYECLYADIGTNGRVADGGVWGKCTLAYKCEKEHNFLPEPECLPFRDEKADFVFVADDAFALKNYMMKPFPQASLDDEKRIYNFRHSRARRISENLFGIIANRWRVFRKVILLPPATIQILAMATLALHNFLRQSLSKNIYCPPGLTDTVDVNGDVIPGLWRNSPPTESFLQLQTSSSGHNSTNRAKYVRELFKDYFCNEGALSWQWGQC